MEAGAHFNEAAFAKGIFHIAMALSLSLLLLLFLLKSRTALSQIALKQQVFFFFSQKFLSPSFFVSQTIRACPSLYVRTYVRIQSTHLLYKGQPAAFLLLPLVSWYVCTSRLVDRGSFVFFFEGSCCFSPSPSLVDAIETRPGWMTLKEGS